MNGTSYPIKREIHTANIIYKTLWDWFTEYIIWNHNWIVQMEVQSAIQSYSSLTSYRSWMSRIAVWFVNADEEETDANVTKCHDTVDFTQGIIVWGTTIICDSIIYGTSIISNQTLKIASLRLQNIPQHRLVTNRLKMPLITNLRYRLSRQHLPLIDNLQNGKCVEASNRRINRRLSSWSRRSRRWIWFGGSTEEGGSGETEAVSFGWENRAAVRLFPFKMWLWRMMMRGWTGIWECGDAMDALYRILPSGWEKLRCVKYF